MEESRKQFDAWFKSDYHPDKTGPYLKDAMFFAWQASRRAIAVNLGKPIYVKHNGDYIHAWPAYNVDIAIRAAGLTVKGDR